MTLFWLIALPVYVAGWLACLRWGTWALMSRPVNRPVISFGGYRTGEYRREFRRLGDAVQLAVCLGFLWPILLLPALALWRLPKTPAQIEEQRQAERKAQEKRRAEMEADIERLERQIATLKGGSE